MLPGNWIQGFGYYITYFGDVYYGVAVEVNNDAGGFYIVGKNKWLEYLDLQNQNKHIENLDRLGIYIPSKEIIEKWVKHIPSLNADNTVFWNGLPGEYKTMYVFGAGASANCLFGEGKNQLKLSAWRPPLGNELFAARFDALIMKYPGLKNILPKFESQGNDIEAILENDWQLLMAGRNIELTAQHMQLQFFLQELFEIISKTCDEQYFRYSLPSLFIQTLFNKKQASNKPVIVSFNYDSILENAIEKHLKINFNHTDQYIKPDTTSPFMFFKPHGSWNWGWAFDRLATKEAGDDIPGWLYRNNISPAELYYGLLGKDMLVADGWGLEARNHPHDIGKITPNKNKIIIGAKPGQYFPALLLPYRDKDEFVMPYQHQLRMEMIMPNIEELVLIGWKGNEKLFNKKLQANAKAVKRIVIANPDAEAVKAELSKYLKLDSYEVVVAKDFEEYVLNLMDK